MLANQPNVATLPLFCLIQTKRQLKQDWWNPSLARSPPPYWLFIIHINIRKILSRYPFPRLLIMTVWAKGQWPSFSRPCTKKSERFIYEDRWALATLLIVLAVLLSNKNKLSAKIFFVPEIFLNSQHTCKSSQISHQMETNCGITV